LTVSRSLGENVHYQCAECARTHEVTLERVCCECGGVLDLRFDVPPPPVSFSGYGSGLIRYRDVLPIDAAMLERASLGLSRTPLLAMVDSTYVKCDFMSPSGSFKDRGAQMLTALALSLGARTVVLDSSGNAGAAMAAHCARVGLACTVVVPSSAPGQKLLQSRAYGATVIAVHGGRAAAADYARSLVSGPGVFYASHVENPFFVEGTSTWAYEVVEQLGDAPGEVMMSVGNGSLLLGAFRGFRYLYEHGRTSRMPRMTAVQARGWSPLTGDVDHGDALPLADGIAIAAPRRLAQIKGAVEATGGDVRVVDVDDITKATVELARRGLWVEPTSGAAWGAAIERGFREDESVVVSLGGAGFKSSAVSFGS
jgi:threonine synthase